MQQKYIDINIPKGWNALTTDQIEQLSRILIDSAKSYSDTGVYNQAEVLVKSFFVVAGLQPITFLHSEADGEVVSIPEDHIDDDLYIECEYKDETKRKRVQYDLQGRFIPIRLYVKEIVQMSIGVITQEDIDKYLKALSKYNDAIAAGKERTEPEPPTPSGPLAWLMKPSSLTKLPYQELTVFEKDKTSGKEVLDSKENKVTVTLQGPAEYMQDFTWQQYRFASEIMGFLSQCENQLVKLKKAKASKKKIEAADAQVHEMRAQWLATLYSRPVRHINRETGLEETSPMFVSSQGSDNSYLFLDFPEEKFQTISFWWQGMMRHLQIQFPKVFKSAEVSSKSSTFDDPFSLYTRSTTTMVKYAASNEAEVNRTTYTIILQHMQDMAEENDRIKEMTK